MGRHRTPTNILELRGTFKKNPHRKRARECEPVPKAGIGAAPDRFKPDEREAWDFLVSISPVGVLGDSDRVYLELTAQLFAYQRSVSVEAMPNSKLGLLMRMLSKLGLNPTDRSRVNIGGRPLTKNPATKNTFVDL